MKLRTRQSVVNYRIIQLELAIKQAKSASNCPDSLIIKLNKTLSDWKRDNSLVPERALGAI